MMKFIISCLLISWPVHGWAATPLTAYSDPQDASIAILSRLFGMPGVLSGSSHHIIERLSAVLSSIIVIIAAGLLTYIMLTGILKTASEGQFLGQKWSSMWIPVRTVVGMLLLMPKGATGYVWAQVIVMSIILQGIGGANLVTKSIRDHFKQGGIIVESLKKEPLLKSSTSTPAEEAQHEELLKKELIVELVEKAGQILKSAVCMMTLDGMCNQQNGYYGMPENEPKLVFPYHCGSVTWPERNQQQKHDNAVNFWESAVRAMILEVSQIAGPMARKVIDSSKEQVVPETQQTSAAKNSPLLKPEVSGSFRAQVTPAFVGYLPEIPQQETFTDFLNFRLIQIAQQAVDTLSNGLRQELIREKQIDQEKWVKYEQTISAGGWLAVGMQYWMLSKLNHGINQSLSLNLAKEYSKLKNQIQVYGADEQAVYQPLSAKQKEQLQKCIKELDQFIKDEAGIDRLGQYYTQAPWIFTQSNAQHKLSEGTITRLLLHPFQKNMQSLVKHMEFTLSEAQDPMIGLPQIGRELLNAVESVWQKIKDGDIQFVGGLVVKEQPETGEWQIISTAGLRETGKQLMQFAALAPILVIWMGIVFSIGAVLVYYVPMIPFLLFFFGALSWFGEVIISIFAAILVPIGLMNPDAQHEVVGDAMQGLRLLLTKSVLRPIFMVIGLMVGMVFCQAAFGLFHYGYRIAIQEIDKFDGVISGMSQIIIIAIYATMSVTIVSRCFALIYELPNRVFTWISWPSEGHNEGEILGQVRGAVDQQVGSVSQQVLGKAIHHGSPNNTDQSLTRQLTVDASRDPSSS
jgi:defect in organelle trafficking protein DotA